MAGPSHINIAVDQCMSQGIIDAKKELEKIRENPKKPETIKESFFYAIDYIQADLKISFELLKITLSGSTIYHQCHNQALEKLKKEQSLSNTKP